MLAVHVTCSLCANRERSPWFFSLFLPSHTNKFAIFTSPSRQRRFFSFIHSHFQTWRTARIKRGYPMPHLATIFYFFKSSALFFRGLPYSPKRFTISRWRSRLKERGQNVNYQADVFFHADFPNADIFRIYKRTRIIADRMRIRIAHITVK